jgi:uncharacterized Zn finger protein (UPF0148 family)
MKCKACRAPATDKDGIILCRSCRTGLERAIRKWKVGIERDLATMEAFDAYCSERVTDKL